MQNNLLKFLNEMANNIEVQHLFKLDAEKLMNDYELSQSERNILLNGNFKQVEEYLGVNGKVAPITVIHHAPN